MSKAEKIEPVVNEETSTEFPAPYLGRSVKIVGPHVNVDMNQSPHPKNARGELGKPLFNWYRNTVSNDPLTRVSAPNHFADRRHFLTNVINRSTKGKINPQRVAVDDPAAMTRHIKAVAHYLGADVVGIAKAHPTFLYAGSRYVQDGTAEDAYQQETPEDLVRKFPYVIQATTVWDYNKLQAHRHQIGDAAYHVSQMKGVLMLKALEGYIKELGYTALRGVVTPQAAGVAGGIGDSDRVDIDRAHRADPEETRPGHASIHRGGRCIVRAAQCADDTRWVAARHRVVHAVGRFIHQNPVTALVQSRAGRRRPQVGTDERHPPWRW